MAVTALSLISESYNLASVVSRDFQTLSASQASAGLTWLNDIIATKSILKRMIPFYHPVTVNLVIGQEIYFIEGLVEAESFTFDINNVRYSSIPKTRNEYFATPRVNNITSLPFSWHAERVMGGSNLYMYFLPYMVMPGQVWGKFSLTEIPTLEYDVSLVYERFYLNYFKYALAAYIRNYNTTPLAQPVLDELKRLELAITDISPQDLTVTKISSFGGSSVMNYAQANIGKGSVPVGSNF